MILELQSNIMLEQKNVLPIESMWKKIFLFNNLHENKTIITKIVLTGVILKSPSNSHNPFIVDNPIWAIVKSPTHLQL